MSATRSTFQVLKVTSNHSREYRHINFLFSIFTFSIFLYCSEFHVGIQWIWSYPPSTPYFSSSAPSMFPHQAFLWLYFLFFLLLFLLFLFFLFILIIHYFQLMIFLCSWVWGHSLQHRKHTSSQILKKEWVSLPKKQLPITP